MKELYDSNLLTHQDLWIDDIGLDVIHQSPTQAAVRSVKAFRLLKASLEASSLVWSKKKTVFVCTSGAAKAAVERLRTSEDPPIALTSTDLGLDCGGGVRHRVTKHRSRFHKAAGRGPWRPKTVKSKSGWSKVRYSQWASMAIRQQESHREGLSGSVSCMLRLWVA